MTFYEKKIAQFKARQPNLLVNIKIGNEEYVLQVHKSMTVKAIIERYKRNGITDWEHVRAEMDGKEMSELTTIQEILKGNGNKAITFQMVNADGGRDVQGNERVGVARESSLEGKSAIGNGIGKGMLKNKGGDDPDKRDSKVVEYQQNIVMAQSQVKEFKPNPNTQLLELTLPQFKHLLQTLHTKQQPNQPHPLPLLLPLLKQKFPPLQKYYEKVLEMLQWAQNSDSKELTYREGLNPYQKKIQHELHLIKVSLDGARQKKELIKEIMEELKDHGRDFGLAIEKKAKSQKKIKSQIQGCRPEVLELLDRFAKGIKDGMTAKDQQIEKYRLERSNFAQKEAAYIKQIQSLHTQISQLKQTLQKLLSQPKPLPKPTIPHQKVCTYYLNKQIFQKDTNFLLSQIQKYQTFKIKSIECLLSLRRNQVQFDVVTSFLDLVQCRTARVLLLVGLDNGGFMGVYSCTGVNKQIKSAMKDSGKKASQQWNETQSQLQKCLSGPGFLADTKLAKTFESSNIDSQLISYDQRFLYLACCFQIMVNMKKRLQLQFKETKRKQLKDDGDQLRGLFGKKKVQITHLEIFRVFVSREEVQGGQGKGEKM